jgi:CubicO group peptidase (beta-lactamase class C family)
MTTLYQDVDPGEVGMDADRLQRLASHFRHYVDDGRLPGWTIVLARDGRIAFLESYGQRDIEAATPVEPDTIFRIYSMTKPITAVAALMLWEEGHFELTDPVSRVLGAFEDLRVYSKGSSTNYVTTGVTEPMRMWHLFSHTAGLTYGFLNAHPVDALYRQAGFEWGSPPDANLAECCDIWASLPLLFQPGSEWNYSVSLDVLGRVVEVLSGMPLDQFFRTRILEPLGMTDTAFFVPEHDHHRLAALYVPNPATGRTMRMDAMGSQAMSPPAALMGGGGLVSTAHDYHRFAQMLARGGELGGTRLLSPRTVAMMASNHLPEGQDLLTFGRPLFAETTFEGVGFGLGVSVTIDPVAAKVPGSVGDFGWGGAASTWFMVDPAEDLTALFLTQLLPSSTYRIRSQIKQLIHQALID